jgi:transcriptional regulator with XRE-family HTH domain
MTTKRSIDGPHRLDVAIGQRVRERRRGIGLSQQELAEALGVSFQQVQKYERGANRISFSRLVEVAGALKCRLADLADGLDPDHRPDHVERVNTLMDCDGALELLEAYVAMPSNGFRRALLHHARNLAELGDVAPAKVAAAGSKP